MHDTMVGAGAVDPRGLPDLHDEIEFMLPRGVTGVNGVRYRQGRMRPATALDEVDALADPGVVRNDAYLGIALLARVVTDLGGHGPATPELIERLPTADYAFLQEVYLQLNDAGVPGSMPGRPTLLEVTCPSCGDVLLVDTAGEGDDGEA